MTVANPITSSPVAPLRMTEAEFVAWVTEETNAEWVAGEVQFKMPISEIHDLLQRAIAASLEALVRRRSLGHVRGEKFTMRLPQGPSRREADLIFVATEHQDRLGKTLLEGPCDIAVEIVSPDSISRDYREKYLEYEAAGVREYWIVDPLGQQLEAHRLNEQGKYVPIAPDAERRVNSAVIPGWWLAAPILFKEPPPDALELMLLLKVVGV